MPNFGIYKKILSEICRHNGLSRFKIFGQYREIEEVCNKKPPFGKRGGEHSELVGYKLKFKNIPL